MTAQSSAIAQQYSSAICVSLLFHVRNEKFGARLKKCYYFKFFTSWKMQEAKVCILSIFCRVFLRSEVISRVLSNRVFQHFMKCRLKNVNVLLFHLGLM